MKIRLGLGLRLDASRAERCTAMKAMAAHFVVFHATERTSLLRDFPRRIKVSDIFPPPFNQSMIPTEISESDSAAARVIAVRATCASR